MRMTDYVTAHVDAHDTRTGAIKLHGRAAFDGMHKAGRLAAETLDMLVPHMVPGVTTGEIDRLIYDFVGSQGGVPATLGYRGYTHSSCISVNHVVCHGGDRKRRRHPDPRRLARRFEPDVPYRRRPAQGEAAGRGDL